MAYEELILGFRFGVFFFAGGVVPNPIDIRFKRVSGLGATVNTIDLREGGQNLYTHKLPDGVTHDNLVLERGMVVGSPLNLEFNAAMSQYTFVPSNVLITLFNEQSTPLGAWLCVGAYPVKWATSDLDASANEVVVDTMELAYRRLQAMRV